MLAGVAGLASLSAALSCAEDREGTAAAPSYADVAPIFARSDPAPSSIVESNMFIDGLPMKPPTKRLTGWS